jgi:hypothetical protein
MAKEWAEYKQAQRGHRNGDHRHCDPRGKCDVARRLHYQNECRIQAIAMFAGLEKAGIDPHYYLGNLYREFKADAEAELPDFDYLRDIADTDYLAASAAIKLAR